MGDASRPAPSPWQRAAGVLGIVFLRDVPFWCRSRARKWARVVAFGVYAYLGVLIVLLCLENYFLFQPSSPKEFWYEPAGGFEDVELTSSDGTRLHAWWAAPPGWTPAQGAMLYSHGNGGNLSGRADGVLHWQKTLKTAVLIYDYPGYGKSAGRPSEAGCYAAGDAAYDWLVTVKEVRPENLVLYGGSMGGAVATDLASRRPCRALVLVAAFSSFPDMAQKSYPFLPARWLVRNQMNNIGKIGKVNAPVFIAHGTADGLVPISQGERLFAAAREPKVFLRMEGAGHNDFPDEEFFADVTDFLHRSAPR